MIKSKNKFELQSDFAPAGDQPEAIKALLNGFKQHEQAQTLLGVTGSGKTFTAAHVIAQMGLPTLVMAHNKTLAAQLYDEFKALFPNNAVEYFVSYYDYYQPEAYVPSSDTYIAKDATINDAIDRMRHAATYALLERNDVIIVSSVSCIYGLGSAEVYNDMLVFLQVNDTIDRDQVLRKLTAIQYERNELDFYRGTFRVRGDSVEVFPAHEQERAIRIAWFGDTIETITLIDPLRGQKIEELDKVAIYPSSHYVVAPKTKEPAIQSIQQELKERLEVLRNQNLLVEAQRLEQRTMFDLEMLTTTGHVNGIENYSRHLTGRNPDEPPPTLIDYFPKDFLLIIDESHQTVPQIAAMYKGDRARKETLVKYGFRLPSAIDNRPLTFDEFEARTNKTLYISATPGLFELEKTKGVIVEQIIRPTGLIDPQVEIRKAAHQVDDLLEEIRKVVLKNQRVLVTTLTKRMAEDLTEFLAEANVRVRYMHSDIDTLERIQILHDLRLGRFDVLVGINLLREGLDLPEVALVAILDADKEGFLRSDRSLVQTIGRAARNIEGRVIMYADVLTLSMKKAIDETERRRQKQLAYNQEHGITPQSTTRSIRAVPEAVEEEISEEFKDVKLSEVPKLIQSLREQMQKAAEELKFEKAAELRDEIREIERLYIHVG